VADNISNLNRDAIIKFYKGAITDWCDHDLALRYAADALGISVSYVSRVVAAAPSLWREPS